MLFPYPLSLCLSFFAFLILPFAFCLCPSVPLTVSNFIKGFRKRLPIGNGRLKYGTPPHKDIAFTSFSHVMSRPLEQRVSAWSIVNVEVLMNDMSRNDPCWCGSGRKYKQCHMAADRGHSGRNRGVVIKSQEQVDGIREASRLTAQILDMVADRIRAGITTEEINTWVHEMTIENGARPAPLNYRGFPKSVCTSLNNVICHGIPSPETYLKDGDIINVDVTSILNGYYGDASRMFLIGSVSPEASRLVQVTKECLDLGIAEVAPGKRLGDVGHAIQKHAESFGYSVVRSFTGHGIGIRFHEPPEVMHVGSPGKGIELRPNMTFTIEPMINVGSFECSILKDGWTAVTIDGSLSAQWEHTLRVTDDGYEILTVS